LTTEGIVLGTPLYMAPEQARSSHAADIRSDLYSLGCVLYHAVTGQPPFPDNNAMVQILRHASELPRPLKEMAPDLPPALQTVMDQFLAKDPAQRFVSSTQAMKALAPFGPPIPALIRANAPMPAYVKWLEQQEGPENQPSAPTPPKTQPTSPAAVPFAKPLTPMFPTPVARPPTTAELARRRSLAAALAVVVLAILGGLLWAGWYFFPSP
jgi:serine/threonine protein kinase